jgi:hypothetical protein
MSARTKGPLAPLPQVVRGSTLRLASVLFSPLALLLGLSVKFAAVRMLGCDDMRTSYAVEAIAVFTVLGCAGGVFLAERARRRLGGAVPVVGLGVSVVATVVAFAQWIPEFVLSPCSR